MASFSERSSSYQIRFYDSRRSPKEKSVVLSKAGWTKREAKSYMRELVVEYDRGEYDPWREPRPGQEGEALALIEAVRRYIGAKVEAGRRSERGGWTQKTRKGNEGVLIDFARQAGPQKRLRDLTTRDLAGFIHQGGLAHATKRGYRRKLRAMVNWWAANLQVDMPEVPPPLEKRRRLPPYLSEDELVTLCAAHRRLATASAKRNSQAGGKDRLWMIDLYWWRFYMGVRPAEAVAQRVGGVDLGRGLVQIGDAGFVPKNKTEQTIPLVPPARPIAERLCEGKDPSERLFGHKGFKKASDAFREALREAFPEKGRVPFYNLRHSCGVYWRRRGVPLSTIQELLRHADPSTTQLYAVIEPGDVGRLFEQAYEAFEDR